MCKKTFVKNCIMLLLFIFACSLMGCGKKKDVPNKENEVTLSYLNKAHTALVTKKFIPKATDTLGIVNEVANELLKDTGDIDRVSPLKLGTTILSCTYENNQVIIDMDGTYFELLPTDEILIRAALVRTFTTVKGVDYVSICILGEALTDTYGNPVGVMSADMFIDNEGAEINSIEEANVRLYFASEDGQHLVSIVRPVSYNSNNAMEKVIMDELIKGPSNTESYPVISKNTKINSVTVADGICYVNLSADFLTSVGNVSSEVMIYAIVNSLAEVSNINKVQLLVDGESNYILLESMDLNVIYERNLDLVIDAEE